MHLKKQKPNYLQPFQLEVNLHGQVNYNQLEVNLHGQVNYNRRRMFFFDRQTHLMDHHLAKVRKGIKKEFS